MVGSTAVPVAASVQAIAIRTSSVSPLTRPVGVIVKSISANVRLFIDVAAVAQMSETIPVYSSDL